MELTAGPFTLSYQNGFIRQIRYGDAEILRMIYFALRDENWGTIQLEIVDEKVERKSSGFSIRCSALNHREGKNLLSWKVAIEGNADGSIVYSLDGEVLDDIKKNRAGFCVLHPLKETIGQPVILSHPDGNRSEDVFPRYIAPEDPFEEVTGMKWRVDGNWFNVEFEGDIFETEDQRNWSDASFKTFCTPLRLPFPVQLRKGERISQRITFSTDSQLPPKANANQIQITKSDTIRKLPELGIGSSPSEEFTEKIFAVLKEANFGHYRIDVDLTNLEWEDIFNNDAMIGHRLELPFEIVLHLPRDPRDEIDKFLNLLREEQMAVKKVTLLSKGELTTRQHHISYIPLLKELLPGTQLGLGTDFNFTELNRHRMEEESADYVTFALDPQEHATDDLTIIENTEAQYYGVVSAFELYNIPVHVSPILLKRKYNPYATDPAAMIVPEAERIDERQQTQFCALWTLGSIKALASAKAETLTYFQSVGACGIVSAEGEPYPVYDVFKLFSDNRRFSFFFETFSSSPLDVDALCFEDGPMLIWNYTDRSQTVFLEPLNRTITLAPNAIEIVD